MHMQEAIGKCVLGQQKKKNKVQPSSTLSSLSRKKQGVRLYQSERGEKERKNDPFILLNFMYWCNSTCVLKSDWLKSRWGHQCSALPNDKADNSGMNYIWYKIPLLHGKQKKKICLVMQHSITSLVGSAEKKVQSCRQQGCCRICYIMVINNCILFNVTNVSVNKYIFFHQNLYKEQNRYLFKHNKTIKKTSMPSPY